MEYLEGESLAEALQDGPLDEAAARRHSPTRDRPPRSQTRERHLGRPLGEVGRLRSGGSL
jgi:hypothetical protein